MLVSSLKMNMNGIIKQCNGVDFFVYLIDVNGGKSR